MEDITNYNDQAGLEVLMNDSNDFNKHYLGYDVDFINSLLNDLPNLDVISEGSIAPIKSESLSPSNDTSVYSFDTCSRSSNSLCEDPDLSKQSQEEFTLKQSSNGKGKSKIACPVCKEGDAGRHKHYGGIACISCRAFFRRSVQNDAYKKFKCPNLLQTTNDALQSCEINSKSWNSCRYCRFHKCLSSGLKISLVLKSSTKSGSQLGRNASIQQIQCAEKTIARKMNSISRNTLSTAGFMNQEVMLISFNVSQYQFEFLRQEMTRFFAERPYQFETLLNAYFRRDVKMGLGWVDIGNAQEFGKWWQQLFCSYLLNRNPDHNALDTESTEVLYNFNMAAVYFINSAISVGNAICPSPLRDILDEVYERQRYLSHFLPQDVSEEQNNANFSNAMNNNNPNEYFITLLARHATRRNIKAKAPEKAIDYNQAYPAEMWNDETRKWEIVIRRNIHAVARWPTVDEDKIKKASSIETQRKSSPNHSSVYDKSFTKEVNGVKIQVDYVLVYLLSLITLYSTDTCTGLKNAGPIEKLQNRYLRLLNQYLSFRYPNDAYLRLARGMDTISKARECCEILQLLS